MTRGSDILHPNATNMTRVLADLDLERTEIIDYRIEDLWDPWKCPEKYLAQLAWALSVDVWDEDWSVDRKRTVIAASPEIHRRKGTRGAVRRSLESLGLTATIEEWWETVPEGRRGTFSVDVSFGDGSDIPSPRLNDVAYAAIRASKPKSRVFDYRSIVSARSTIHVAASASVGMFWESFPPEFDPPALSADIPAGSATQHHFINEVST